MRDGVWEQWEPSLGSTSWGGQSSYGDAGQTETDKNVPSQPNGKIFNTKEGKDGLPALLHRMDLEAFSLKIYHLEGTVQYH